MPVVNNEADILNYLDARGLPYQRIEHPAVYTCADVGLLDLPARGLETKNLFLRDEQGSYYLVMTACEKRLDLKRLSRETGGGRLQFGPPEALQELLGLAPGAVTVLALANDTAGRVRLLVDAQYWPSPAYLCHPMVNTATLVLDHPTLERFLALTGHTPQVAAMAGR